jgi:hypothetical protein
MLPCVLIAQQRWVLLHALSLPAGAVAGCVLLKSVFDPIIPITKLMMRWLQHCNMACFAPSRGE